MKIQSYLVKFLLFFFSSIFAFNTQATSASQQIKSAASSFNLPASPNASGTSPSFSPSSSSSSSSSGPNSSGSSGSSSNSPSSESSNQSSAQSGNASNASSNASLSIPGHFAEKVPGNPVDVSTATEDFVRLKKGWVVSYAYKIFDKSKPTLLLLPGIYRGLEKEEECLRALEALNINYVAIHFSTHLKSIQHLTANEVPHFDGGKPNLKSSVFAQEVEAVYKKLRIKKPVVVSLSYSATIVEYLNAKTFPVVIEMAPMGRQDEDSLMQAGFQRNWEYWTSLIPFYGPAYVQTVKNQYYHSIWTPVVQFLGSQMPALNQPDLFQKQLDAYVAMTFASENFDLSKTNFRTGAWRAWVLAESEGPTRAYFQAQALKNYLATLDKNTLENSVFGKQGVVIIQKSGHTIPQEQPTLYASALKELLTKIELENIF